MTEISLDKALAENLVDTKLRVLQDEIGKILQAWKYTDAARFLKDAKKGVIREAEDDAIGMTNLLDQREKLLQLKKRWNS